VAALSFLTNTSTGAYLISTNASDKNLKEIFVQVDPQAILPDIADLEIQSWNYRSKAVVQGTLMSEPQTKQPTSTSVVRLCQE
jgi:hypothetical protein